MIGKSPPAGFEPLMAELESLANPRNVIGQQQFGIRGGRMLGIPLPELRRLARGQTDHELAQALWNSGVHEARLLATMMADASRMTRRQADAWVESMDSWDLVDQACNNLFRHLPFAVDLAMEWSKREGEFIRRAGFALMAVLAVHNKSLPDETFRQFFLRMVEFAGDDRNYVKKAVSWALRQAGKSRPGLRQEALQTAVQIRSQGTPSARWIANDVLRELLLRRGGK